MQAPVVLVIVVAFVVLAGVLRAAEVVLVNIRRDVAAPKKSRQLTRFNNTAATWSFDVTADGKQVVFDRLRENSDIVLIDLAR